MKSVLVTGGTTRLGKAIADHLRRVGWRVITSSHRPDAGADIVADLSEPLGAAKLYAAALRLLEGQPPDALVNNAALFTGDDETLEAVNRVAPVKLTMMMAGRETGRGSVVNVLDCRVLPGGTTSVSSAYVPPVSSETPYARTKRELLGETRRLAALLSATLRVNAVAPGPVLPPIGVHERAGETLLGRPTPEDVAKAVAFLLEAQATTAAILPVDGGQSVLF